MENRSRNVRIERRTPAPVNVTRAYLTTLSIWESLKETPRLFELLEGRLERLQESRSFAIGWQVDGREGPFSYVSRTPPIVA